SDIGYRISDIGYRISDIGYRISDIGYRISDIGYGYRVSGIGPRSPRHPHRQGARHHAHGDTAAGPPDLPVQVIHDIAIRLERRAGDAANEDARRALDRAEHEMAAAPQPRERRAIVDDDRLQLSVVHPRARREADAVAVLASVGERDEHRGREDLLAVEHDAVPQPAVAEGLAQANLHVRSHAPSPERAGVELFGHHRVDAGAGDVEEQAAVEFAAVDRPVAPVERGLDRQPGLGRQPELVREAVPRSGGNDPERRPRSRERRRHFIDRAVAAP